LSRNDKRVGLVDDDDPAAPFERAICSAIDEIAHLLNLDRTAFAGLDNENVGMDVSRDPRARSAHAAGVEKGASLFVVGQIGPEKRVRPLFGRSTVERLRGRNGGQA